MQKSEHALASDIETFMLRSERLTLVLSGSWRGIEKLRAKTVKELP
jgi:hypothetical protein